MNTVAATILSLVISQMNPTLGDIEGNLAKMISHAKSARDHLSSDIVIFPKSSIVGYPPQDLVNEESYSTKISQAIDELKKITGIAIVIEIANNVSDQIIVINNGNIAYEYISIINAENKYLAQSVNPKDLNFFKCKKSKIGFLIGNNIENNNILSAYKNHNLDLIISLNSPMFHLQNYNQLVESAKDASSFLNSHIICSCLVGGQDKYIFTGGSFAIDNHQTMIAQAKYLQEQLLSLEFTQSGDNIVGKILDNPEYNSTEMLYNCLVLSLQDYVHKNGFNKVVLEVSGSIDSALVATIATDALGKENITAVTIGHNYTNSTNMQLIEKLANNLKIELKKININEIYNIVTDEIIKSCKLKIKSNTVVRELKIKSRSLLLTTIANIDNALILNTMNKSEMAIGNFHIHDSNVKSFALLADIFKTTVDELANYRNTISHIIPKEIIANKLTTELYSQQLDQDCLPEYTELDTIIGMYLKNESIDDIVTETAYDKIMVQKILNLITNAEYKRNQTLIFPLVEDFSFDKSYRNYPITNKWNYCCN